MRVALAALVLVASCAPDGRPPTADRAGETGLGSGGGDTGGDGGGSGSCVYGALRSDQIIDVVGEVDDVRGDIPLAGVSVVDCETAEGGLSVEGGGWSVPSRDATYVTMLAEVEGALPARWLFDPRVEGVPDMPFRQDMMWEDTLTSMLLDFGVPRDPGAVVVVIEAMDPDTRVDLADAVVATIPPAEAFLTISLEGVPMRSDTTNGLHDVAGLNVEAGPVSIAVDAGPDRTCRVPDPIVVPPGGLLALTAYCPLTAR